MDLQRIQALSGRHPQQVQLDKLKTEQAAINAAYAEAISAAQRNEPINEGLFSALNIAVGTAAKLGKSVAGAAAEKVKKMGSAVKEFYKDAKAQAELEQLVKEMNGIIKDFQDIEKAAPTILSRDPEVKKTMELFSSLLKNSVATLSARQASIKGVTESIDIQKIIDDSQLTESGSTVKDALVAAKFVNDRDSDKFYSNDDAGKYPTKEEVIKRVDDEL